MGALWSLSAVPKVQVPTDTIQGVSEWHFDSPSRQAVVAHRQSSAPASVLLTILRAELYWQEEQ